ncbi:unnamed protein product [Ixodes pacificus]
MDLLRTVEQRPIEKHRRHITLFKASIRELCIYAGRLLVIDFYLWLCLHVGFPVALVVSYSVVVCVPKSVNSIPAAIPKFQSILLLFVCMLFHNRYIRVWE